MIVAGIILVIAGLLLHISILWIRVLDDRGILVGISVILTRLALAGCPVGGRHTYY